LDLITEGKNESALKHLSMAVCIAPNFCNAYNAMGKCLYELGRFGAAVEKYGKVLEINPFHAEARLKRALVMKKIEWAGEQKGDSVTANVQKNERSTHKTGRRLWERTDIQICFHTLGISDTFLIFTFLTHLL
jgi:lipoprotein NlpI